MPEQRADTFLLVGAGGVAACSGPPGGGGGADPAGVLEGVAIAVEDHPRQGHAAGQPKGVHERFGLRLVVPEARAAQPRAEGRVVQ